MPARRTMDPLVDASLAPHGTLTVSIRPRCWDHRSATAGGLKVTTFMLMLFAIVAEVRGHPTVDAFGRQVPTSVLRHALSVALLGVARRRRQPGAGHHLRSRSGPSAVRSGFWPLARSACPDGPVM